MEKTGGSNPTIVPAGNYQVKITLDDGTDPEISTLGAYIITVDASSVSVATSTPDSDNTDDVQSTTTPDTTATSTATTTQTNTVIEYISTHSSPEDLSNYDTNEVFQLSAGRNRIGYLGAPLEFDANHRLSAGVIGSDCQFSWSFGDGLEDSGEKVSHVYKYPGDYSVVLNGDCGGADAVSRTDVQILVPHISVAITGEGDIEVGNTGDTEINLGTWSLVSASSSFVFPKDTIVGAGKDIILSSEDTKIYLTASSTVILQSPLGKEVSTTEDANTLLASSSLSSSTSTASSSEITVAQAEILAQKYKATRALKKENTPSAASASPSDINSVQNTATVIDAIDTTSTQGFWSRVLNAPKNTFGKIFHSFYNL